MSPALPWDTVLILSPAGLMALATLRPAWSRLHGLAALALLATVVQLGLWWWRGVPAAAPPGLAGSLAAGWVAVLVQGLGTVIAHFSARYLWGEPGQDRAIRALAAVLAAVHLLLMADHWVLLVVAWAAVGSALQRLLCFYPDRPFALLAAHKKRVADRLADALLLLAAGLAWWATGTGHFSGLAEHLARHAPGPALQASAVCLVLAVALRTALLPVHGWLMQVMEAPTPVSALLHAGVVNLGGVVLIRQAALLEAVPAARWLLAALGLATAILAGLVMLTRVSVKVRLAWSTAAQMGFMVLECALGLYTLALLHLIGHSLYKAHAFLSASEVVAATRLRRMQGPIQPAGWSLWLAPVAAGACLAGLAAWWPTATWPIWWGGVLALAWAPLLWLPRATAPGAPGPLWHLASGLGLVTLLALATLAAHALPFGLQDQPDALAGPVALAGLAALYLGAAALHRQPAWLAVWRRWAYAGFYLDEQATRLVLRLWPTHWTRARAH